MSVQDATQGNRRELCHGTAEALKVPLMSSWAFQKVLPVLLCCWQPFRESPGFWNQEITQQKKQHNL